MTLVFIGSAHLRTECAWERCSGALSIKPLEGSRFRFAADAVGISIDFGLEVVAGDYATNPVFPKSSLSGRPQTHHARAEKSIGCVAACGDVFGKETAGQFNVLAVCQKPGPGGTSKP